MFPYLVVYVYVLSFFRFDNDVISIYTNYFYFRFFIDKVSVDLASTVIPLISALPIGANRERLTLRRPAQFLILCWT
jgi:hypothetical protein